MLVTSSVIFDVALPALHVRNKRFLQSSGCTELDAIRILLVDWDLNEGRILYSY